MRKLYGDSLRKDAGFTKVVKSVASRNARLLENSAGRHAPELKRVVREVRGTFEKVYEDTAEVVEEFLTKCMPTQSRFPASVDANGCLLSETKVEAV
jgi:phosphatidylethanolamine N-methyltransferase